MSFATAALFVALVLFNCAGATRNPKAEEVSVLEVSSTGKVSSTDFKHFTPQSVENTTGATIGEAEADGAIPKRMAQHLDPEIVDQHLKILLVQQNAPPHGHEFAHDLVRLAAQSDVDVIVLTLQDFHLMHPNDAASGDGPVAVNNGVAATVLPNGASLSSDWRPRPIVFPSLEQFGTSDVEFISAAERYSEGARKTEHYIRQYLSIITGDCKKIKRAEKPDVVGPVALAVYVRTNVETKDIVEEVPERGRRAGKTCKGTLMVRAVFQKRGVGGLFHVIFGSTHGEDGVDEVALRMRYRTVHDGAREMLQRGVRSAILWGGDFNSRYVHRLPDGFEPGTTYRELSQELFDSGDLEDDKPVYMNMPRIGDPLDMFCQYALWLELDPEKHKQWCMTEGLDRQANADEPCRCSLMATHHVHTTAWDTLQVKGAKYTREKRGLDALIVTDKKDGELEPFGLFRDSFVMCEHEECQLAPERSGQIKGLMYDTHDVLGINEAGSLGSHHQALEEGSREATRELPREGEREVARELAKGGTWEVIPSGLDREGGECLPLGSDPELCRNPTFKMKRQKGSSLYDIGVSRPTSWPDRVMYRSGSHTKVTRMQSGSYNFDSDHMAILARFELEIDGS